VPPSRRSCLSVPGSSQRMLAKAPSLGADELVLDLEDAVAAPAKEAARAQVVAALAAGAFGDATVSVRVNAPGTPWCHSDLIALAGTEHASSVVVPKVGSPADLHFVDRLLDGAERAAGRARPLRVQALIETAAGVAGASAIAAASPRLDALILGYADLAAALGRTRAAAADPGGWRPLQDALLLAARACGLQAIDGPYLGTSADAAFRAAATHARELGFDGKWAVHPSQVAELNAIFTPTDEELAHARRVIGALDDAAAHGGHGAVALDGEMLDEALRAAAERVLARAGA
jgi:citrate lyase subunit beta / citryl-CoA lyase